MTHTIDDWKSEGYNETIELLRGDKVALSRRIAILEETIKELKANRPDKAATPEEVMESLKNDKLDRVMLILEHVDSKLENLMAKVNSFDLDWGVGRGGSDTASGDCCDHG